MFILVERKSPCTVYARKIEYNLFLSFNVAVAATATAAAVGAIWSEYGPNASAQNTNDKNIMIAQWMCRNRFMRICERNEEHVCNISSQPILLSQLSAH